MLLPLMMHVHANNQSITHANRYQPTICILDGAANNEERGERTAQQRVVTHLDDQSMTIFTQ